MTTFNLSNQRSIEENYQNGLLPQRNHKDVFYQDSSSRCDLKSFSLSSENRRIIKKTEDSSYQVIPLSDFKYTPQIQKQIHDWVKELGWDFPTSSIKMVFTNHLFNYVYLWYDKDKKLLAYNVCFLSPSIGHTAYVFYNPEYSHNDIVIRIPLQFVIDCHQKNLDYAYLGRFNPDTKLGYYKRNFPGFEYFSEDKWLKFEK